MVNNQDVIPPIGVPPGTSRHSSQTMGISRNMYNVIVVAFVYMIVKTVVMALFTFITVAIGEFDTKEAYLGIYLIAIFNIGSATTALPISEYFRQLGRFRGFIVGLLILLSGLTIVLFGLVWRSHLLLFFGTLFLGGGSGIMNFLRFAAAEVCRQDSLDRGLALIYVNGAAVMAAVLGPALTILSHIMIPEEKFLGAVLLLSLATTGCIGLLWTVKFPRLEGALASTTAAAVVADEAEAITCESGQVIEAPRPLTKILRSRSFVIALGMVIMGGATMVAYMAVIPLVMYYVNGYSYGVMSLVMIVHMLGMTLTSFITGPLIFLVGIPAIAVLGLALYAVSWVCFYTSHGNIFGFVLGACWLGVGWNLLSNCAALVVLGTVRRNEDDMRERVQSVFEFWHYLANAFVVFIAANLYVSEGWQGVMYMALVLTVLMLIVGLYVTGAGWVSLLDFDKLFEGRANKASKARDDTDSELESGTRASQVGDAVMNPVVRSLDDRLSAHATAGERGRSRADSAEDEYSSMGDGESVRSEYRNSKVFRASLAAQFAPGRLPGERGEGEDEDEGGKKASAAGGDVELAEISTPGSASTPKASHSH